MLGFWNNRYDFLVIINAPKALYTASIIHSHHINTWRWWLCVKQQLPWSRPSQTCMATFIHQQCQQWRQVGEVICPRTRQQFTWMKQDLNSGCSLTWASAAQMQVFAELFVCLGRHRRRSLFLFCSVDRWNMPLYKPLLWILFIFNISYSYCIWLMKGAKIKHI